MATIITQLDGAAALNGTTDDDIIVAQHLTGAGVPTPQVLTGGAGNDVIFGDHDELTVDGSTSTGNATLANAISIDAIQLWGQRENPDVADSTSVPYTTILGQGDGNNDFFAVTVGAGETITLDLDYGLLPSGSGAFDSVVELQDSAGTVLASNDDNPSNDDGALGSQSDGLRRDSFFSFVNTGVSQVFYIKVSDFNGGVPTGATYMLNVSVTNHVMSNLSTFGDDDISGGAGDDVLYGSEGDDTLDGGADDDLIEGGSGADTIIGGTGSDTISYSTSAVGVNIQLATGNGFSFGGTGSDADGDTFTGVENVIGSAQNDFLAGDSNANIIDGGDGFDTVGYFFDDAGIDVDLAAGTISGGNTATGDTLINIEAVNGSNLHGDAIRGDDGDNILSGTGGDDILEGRGGNDTLNGDDDDDTLDGGQGNDVLRGGAGNDILRDTGNSNSTLQSDDILDGGAGDDILEANFGSDEFIGGSGIDTLQIAGSVVDGPPNGPFGFNIDLVAGTDTFGNTYTGIENVNGGGGDDTIDGDANDNVLTGGSGNDILNGAGGNDTLDGGTGDDTVSGGDDDDTLSDGLGADTVDGGAGNDTFLLRAGQSDLGNSGDVVDGGTGTDTVEIIGAYNQLATFDMAAGTYNIFGADRTVQNFENFDASGLLTGRSDTFDVTGTSGANTIIGGYNDDILDGGDGNDTIRGGDGDDILSDGASTDDVQGGDGNDVILIRAGSQDWLSIFDSFDGGAGIDTFRHEKLFGSVDFDLEAGVATNAGVATDATNFENFDGALQTAVMTIQGTSGVNIITTGSGDDTIEGRGGADTMDGGAGIDTLSYESAGSGVALAFTTGAGVGGDADGDTFTNFEAFRGSDFNDFVTALQTTSYTYEGRGGNDNFGLFSFSEGGGKTFDGGAGFDTMDLLQQGATAFIDLRDDTLISMERLDFDAVSGNVLDSVLINAAQMDDVTDIRAAAHAGDTVQLDIFMDGRTNLDLSGLTVTGFTETGDQITITGDGDDETIIGSSINDDIDAGGGNDTIEGTAGADVIDGGAGIDTLSYESSDQSVAVNLDANIVSGGHADDDEISNFENVIGSAFSDNLIGNNNDNVLTGGAGNDGMRGLGGRDEFYGGAGNDNFQTGNLASHVVAGEVYDGGADRDSITIEVIGTPRTVDLRDATLTSVEQLLFRSDAGSFIGDLAAQLTVLQAVVSGLDTIGVSGRAAGDSFDAQFFMDEATAVDLSGLSFIGNFGATGTGDTVTIIGDGDDETIAGTSIADVINGNGGNDTIKGGAGADTLDGGAGVDLLTFEDSTSGVNLTATGGTSGDAAGDTYTDIENFTGSEFADSITGNGDDNELRGLGGNDNLIGLGGLDKLFGGDGDDRLDFGDFASHLVAGEVFDGGTGFDTLKVKMGGTPREYDANLATLSNLEELEFSSAAGFFKGDVTFSSTVANFAASGITEFDIELRDAGDIFTVDLAMGANTNLDMSDYVFKNGFGTDEADKFEVTGDTSNEFVTGSGITDVVNLGAGNDTYAVVDGTDTVDLGTGNDFLQINSDFVSVGTGSTFNGGANFDIVVLSRDGVSDLRGATFTGFENLEFLFTPDAERLVELTDTQVLSFDTIDGNENTNGRDSLDIFVTSGGTVDFSGLTFNDWGTGAGTQNDIVMIRDENVAGQTIIGTDQSDFFIDDSSASSLSVDTLFGGAGGDTFVQNDFAFFDDIDGGTGFDTVDYSSHVTAGLTADLEAGTVSQGGDTGVLTSIESLRGTQLADTISSSSVANIIRGNGGDDVLIDNFDGTVADEYDGGDGIDTIEATAVQWGADVIFDLMEGNQRFGAGFTTVVDTYLDIENVTVNGRAQIRGDDGDNVLTAITGPGAGGSGSFANIINAEGGNDIVRAGDDDDVVDGGFGNDELFGEDGDDVLIGGLGNDRLDGGAGIDTADYSDAGGRVAVFLARTPADLGSGQGIDTFVSIENVVGTDFDDRLVGDNNENMLVGGLGDDVLIGLGGADVLDGGIGDDELTGSGGDDTLLGGSGADQLFGLGGADTLDGGGGNDFIEGGLGVDTIIGGTGDDEIFGFFGVDTIDGGNGADNIRADGSGDIVNGGGGNDRVVGGNGRDTLWGGTGNDTLFGGGGSGAGDGLRDVFVFKSAANGGGGFDIIRDFEDTIDKIDLTESGYTTFADVLADASQVGANVEINFDFSGLLRINNFDIADLTAGDFIF